MLRPSEVQPAHVTHNDSATMTSSRLSAATMGVLSALLLPPSPGSVAFVVTPNLRASSATAIRSSASYRSFARHGGGLRMSTSREASAAAADAAEDVVGDVVEERRIDPSVTELPDSFEDSIARMGRSTLQCMEEVI